MAVAGFSVGDFTGTTSTITGTMVGADELSAVRGWVEAPVSAGGRG